MDPNLFHLDYERLLEVLVTIVVLSFLIERALSVIFESRPFIEWNEGIKLEEGKVKPLEEETSPRKKKGVKELIALVVTVSTCFVVDFDALTIILASNDHVTNYGTVLTGAIIAGGSKASIALFKDVMNFMSNAERQRQEWKKSQKTGE